LSFSCSGGAMACSVVSASISTLAHMLFEVAELAESSMARAIDLTVAATADSARSAGSLARSRATAAATSPVSAETADFDRAVRRAPVALGVFRAGVLRAVVVVVAEIPGRTGFDPSTASPTSRFATLHNLVNPGPQALVCRPITALGGGQFGFHVATISGQGREMTAWWVICLTCGFTKPAPAGNDYDWCESSSMHSSMAI